ncbi:MAG: hypothetical protein R2761_23665 [Acidimicrobiales bacterium]
MTNHTTTTRIRYTPAADLVQDLSLGYPVGIGDQAWLLYSPTRRPKPDADTERLAYLIREQQEISEALYVRPWPHPVVDELRELAAAEGPDQDAARELLVFVGREITDAMFAYLGQLRQEEEQLLARLEARQARKEAAATALTPTDPEVDLLGDFLKAKASTGDGLKASSSELFTAWEAWCAEREQAPGNPMQFSKAMQERDFEKVKSSGVMVWRGVGLNG